MIFAGGGENGKTSCLCLSPRPGPFPSPAPCRRSSPCGPPRSSRLASGRPRCAAAAPLSTAPSPSPHGKTAPYPHPWMSSAGVWSWTGRVEEQMEGGEATGSRRLAGKNPLKNTPTDLLRDEYSKYLNLPRKPTAVTDLQRATARNDT